MMSSLSSAIGIYLGFGTKPFPSADADNVLQAFGNIEGHRLVLEIKELLKVTEHISIDWTSHDILEGSKLFREVLLAKFPELDAKAVDAITWKFTYDWR